MTCSVKHTRPVGVLGYTAHVWSMGITFSEAQPCRRHCYVGCFQSVLFVTWQTPSSCTCAAWRRGHTLITTRNQTATWVTAARKPNTVWGGCSRYFQRNSSNPSCVCVSCVWHHLSSLDNSFLKVLVGRKNERFGDSRENKSDTSDRGILNLCVTYNSSCRESHDTVAFVKLDPEISKITKIKVIGLQVTFF